MDKSNQTREDGAPGIVTGCDLPAVGDLAGISEEVFTSPPVLEQPGTPDEENQDLISLQCPECGAVTDFKLNTEAFSCGKCSRTLDLTRDKFRPNAVRPSMQEKGTGIRKRRRIRLGFRRMMKELTNAAGDPEMGGFRKERLESEWIDIYLFPWENFERGTPEYSRWKTVCITGVGLLAFGIIAVSLWRYYNVVETPVRMADFIREEQTGFEDTLPERFSAAGVATRAFLAADSVEKMLPLVRDRERVEPAIRAWYSNSPPFTAKVRKVTGHGAASARDRVFARMVAETVDYHTVVVSLEETPDGWKADWESFVNWGEAHWPELAASTDAGREPALMRGWLSLEENYEPPFDAESHQSCTLRSPDRNVVVSAWMQRDEDAMRLLRGAFFDAKASQIEAIVRLRPAPGGTPGRMEIVEILQTGWIQWEGAATGGTSLFRRKEGS